jgi:hypothetical protein
MKKMKKYGSKRSHPGVSHSRGGPDSVEATRKKAGKLKVAQGGRGTVKSPSGFA